MFFLALLKSACDRSLVLMNTPGTMTPCLCSWLIMTIPKQSWAVKSTHKQPWALIFIVPQNSWACMIIIEHCTMVLWALMAPWALMVLISAHECSVGLMGGLECSWVILSDQVTPPSPRLFYLSRKLMNYSWKLIVDCLCEVVSYQLSAATLIILMTPDVLV